MFFKPGVLADLQLEKELKLNNFVIALQSLFRGASSRKRVDGLMVGFFQFLVQLNPPIPGFSGERKMARYWGEPVLGGLKLYIKSAQDI